MKFQIRGHGAIGSAPALQAGGSGFESPCLHRKKVPATAAGTFCVKITVSTGTDDAAASDTNPLQGTMRPAEEPRE